METGKSKLAGFLFNRSVQGIFYQIVTLGLVEIREGAGRFHLARRTSCVARGACRIP